MRSATVPLRVVIDAASITPVIYPSKVFNTEEESDISVRIIATFSNPLIPGNGKMRSISAAVPINLLTFPIFIIPVVYQSKVFKSEKVSDVLVIIIASVPSPLISDEE